MNLRKPIFALLFLIVVAVYFFTIAANASGDGYSNIEETESLEVIRITEEIAEIYPICPEVLQSLIFYESSNRRTVVSLWGDIGYMQINPNGRMTG